MLSVNIVFCLFLFGVSGSSQGYHVVYSTSLWTADIPQHSLVPICPHSFLLSTSSLFVCVLSFAIHLWLVLLFAVKSCFPLHVFMQSVFFQDLFLLFLLCFLTFLFLFWASPEGEVQHSRYEARDPHVSGVQHPWTQRTPTVQTCPRQAWR